jgi:hypothetical protein
MFGFEAAAGFSDSAKHGFERVSESAKSNAALLRLFSLFFISCFIIFLRELLTREVKRIVLR